MPAVSTLVPGYAITRVIFPERPDAPMRFIVHEGTRAEFYKASNLFFHPSTGALLRADLRRDRLAGDSLVHWIGAVHYGAFGSWPIRMLWAIGGSFLSAIAMSGVIVLVNTL
jgi:uncharacterized iron-regulated membrane protein